MSKLVVVAAAAVGYVLGTRVESDQYEKTMENLQRWWRDPRVQEKTAQVTDVAKGKATQVKDQLADRGKQATAKARGSDPRHRGSPGLDAAEAS